MEFLLRVIRAISIGFVIFILCLTGVDLTTAYLTESTPGSTAHYVIGRTGEYLEKKFVLGITKIPVQNSVPQVLPQIEDVPEEHIVTAPAVTAETLIKKPEKEEQPKTTVRKKLSQTESAELTPSGILIITNQERITHGKGPLVWNNKLAIAALRKAKDMETRQYFAHQSPDGKGPHDLAKGAEYDYMLIGENLALGDFYSDRDVMDGWMNSPGHRENILKDGYTELGAAAFLGTYNNRPAWFAVQEFGRPEPACPRPDNVEKAWIEKEHKAVREIAESLDSKRVEIDTFTGDPLSKSKIVSEFNVLVATHNQKLDSLKGRIAIFNGSVTIYNACISHARELAGISATDTIQTGRTHD